MAHSEVTLSIAAGFASRKRWSQSKPDYVPEWVSSSSVRLEDERTKYLKQVFRDWDANRDGFITYEELACVFRKLGLSSQRDIEYMLKEADKDGSGQIDLEEFLGWLYDSATIGAHLVDYGGALRVLFDVYDRGGSGFITYEEFEEVHCIMQGSLRLTAQKEEDDGEAGIASLGLNDAADTAFAHADRKADRQIAYFEFVEYMCKMIDPKHINQEEFCEVTLKLAGALKTLLKGVAKAERGEIKESDSHVLELMIQGLAETTRDFHEALSRKVPAKKPQKWIDPPRGLSIEHLKATHMKFNPVNVLLTDSFVYDIVCVPTVDEGKEGTSERTWIGEVVRKVTYKSGVRKVEQPAFYKYDDDTNAWKLLNLEDTSSFEENLKKFDPEFGLFCIMKCEADYGTELDWKGVKNALHTGVVMGWLSADDERKYIDHMEELVKEKIRGDPENLKEAVQSFLYSNLIQRPRAVMATLSKLEIVDVHPMWQHFMSHAV